MQNQEEGFEAELSKPRIGFLISSAVAALLAAAAFLFEEDIIAQSPSGSGVTYALILLSLVFAAMFLLLCYRVPRIGNRVLGYNKMTVESDKKVKSDVQFSAGFKSDSAADTKRQNTKRKQARHSRRKLAAVTREMQQEKAQQAQSATKDPSKGKEENPE